MNAVPTDSCDTEGMTQWAALPLVCAAAVLAFAAQEVRAQVAGQDMGVGVELVLAVDVSRSMDPSEHRIQRLGYAAAFRSTEVQQAILDGIWGRAAIAYVEWAGEANQRLVIPWTLIDSREAAEAFAAAIEEGSATSAAHTSISGGISFSAALFENNGFAGMRRIIDISGDGPNNQGRVVAEARSAAVMRGITINGLPLMTNGRRDYAYGFGNWGTINNLDAYYADCVIGGPGAFVIPVRSWDQFAAAVRQKLVLELAGRMPPAVEQLTLISDAPAVDCLIGEKMRASRERWGP